MIEVVKMKVLVATQETQGKRENDFNHADTDELVRFVFECDGESVDGRCGCRRSMSGVNSLKATTTVQVKSKKMSPEEYKTRIRKSLQKGGWNPTEKMVAGEAKELLRIANYFPERTVLEKRGDTFAARKPTEESLDRNKFRKSKK
jgi:hypothetical protein